MRVFFRLNFAYRVRPLKDRFLLFSAFRCVGPSVCPSSDVWLPIVFSTNNVSIIQDHIPIVSASLCSARARVHNDILKLIVADCGVG